MRKNIKTILVLSGLLIAAVLLSGCVEEISNNATVTPSPTPTPEVTPSVPLKKEIHEDFDATPALAGLLEPAWLQPRVSNITKEDIGFEVTMTDDVRLPMDYIGKPIVPYIVKWFKIPRDSEVESVVVNLSNPIDIHSIFIEPAPKPPRAEYVIDNETYSSSEPYPGKKYDYKVLDHIKWKEVVVHVFPIQYFPVESRVVAYRNASISISYHVPAQEGCS